MANRSRIKNDLKGLFTKVRKAIGPAQNKLVLKILSAEAISIIVKRTRLGYGVRSEGGERFKLSSIPWSDKYKLIRKTAPLDSTTAPKKSNLTFTGQMLRSIKVIKITGNTIVIGPTGTRDDGQTNMEVAASNAKRGATFMMLSKNEHAQLIRLARRSFTDLLKRLAKAR